MYNRYIPGSTGIYERRTVEEPKKDLPCVQELPAAASEPPIDAPCTKRDQPLMTGGPFHMDLGDLLLLCVVLLLLVDCEDENRSSLLITAAAFLLLQ